MASLKLQNIRKQYNKLEVLKGIDIEIEDGGFLVLVGPSGCGKSTLLNCIAGLEDISSGDIMIGEKSVVDLHPSQRDIAMVFQSYALYPNMNVEQNIAFGMEMRGIAKPEREAAIARVAETLQITELLKRKPSQLSGGQRQRVAMGRALVRDPQVFLFDEPLSNLDAKLRVDMRTEIKKLHQTMGTTIVYVTHDQIEALTLATKIAVLKFGELQQFGTPKQIYDQPNNLFVAEFMGSPSMNLMRARIIEAEGTLTAHVATGQGATLVLPLHGFEALNAHKGTEVILGLRPEAITDEASASGQDQSKVLLQSCQINVVEPAGSDTFVTTSLGGKEVIARLGADAVVSAGESMPLAFNMAKAVFFDPSSEQRIA